MPGAFEEGTILWYWYSQWAAVPILVLAIVAAHRVLRDTSWSKLVPLASKTLVTLGTLSVATVVLDRIGFYTAISPHFPDQPRGCVVIR